MDLTFKLGGITLESPVIASSCEDGRDGERIKKVAGWGPGAITTKTIVPMPEPPHDPLPCLARIKGGFVNCVLATVVPAREWFERDFAVALSGGVPVIANMAGTTPEECVELARGCEKAGATMIEYPSACPHMGGILEAMYPGLEVPMPEVHDSSYYARCIAAIKEEINIPLIAKLSAIHHYVVKDWAVAAQEAGADAIAAADTIGPAIAIDTEDGQPLLGGPRGYGGLSGAALKPLVLKMILEISEAVEIPVIGIGGVSSGLDAIEYFMVGASAVEVATASNLYGPQTYQKIHQEIEEYLEARGYNSIEDIRGMTLQRIEERKQANRQIIHDVVVPEVDEESCTGCGKCEDACVYEAIEMKDRHPVFKAEACYGCGLCSTVCPRGAIVQEYYQ